MRSVLAFGLGIGWFASAQSQQPKPWPDDPQNRSTSLPERRHLERGAVFYHDFYVKCGRLSDKVCGLELLDRVIEESNQALGIDPNYPAARDLLGNALDSKREFDAAIAQYRIALHLLPTYAAAHNDLAVALGDKGDHEGAIAEFKEALHFAPNAPNST